MPEGYIFDPVAQDPGLLGYRRAHTVTQLKWGKPGGTADLVIFPRSGTVKLAIVEAKRAKADEHGQVNSEAHARVIGQLLKYYARALTFTVEGIDRVVQKLDRRRRRRHDNLSLRQILGVPSEADAATILSAGSPLKPAEIACHILVNHPTRALEDQLSMICRALDHHHHLPIGVWSVEPSPLSKLDYGVADSAPRWLPARSRR